MFKHKYIPMLLIFLLVIVLSGCSTILPKIEKLVNEPFKGPSWDVAVDVPLVHKYKIPVGEELAKALKIDPENNEATLSYKGTIEGSEPMKLDLSSLSFKKVIDLDAEVQDILDSVIGNFENPATPTQFRYPFTAIDDITNSFDHVETFEFNEESQTYLDQIAESLLIQKSIEVTAGQDYVDDMLGSLAFEETVHFDDNTADYITDITQQLNIHEEFSMEDKSADIANDVSNFLDFSDQASIPDESAGTMDQIREDFVASFFNEMNSGFPIPLLSLNSKESAIGTFESIQFHDDFGNPYFSYVVFAEGQLQLTVNNTTGTNIANLTVSLRNYASDAEVSSASLAVVPLGETELILDLAGQTMSPEVYLVIELSTEGPANGQVGFTLTLDPDVAVSVKKVVVDELQSQVTQISQPLPASASGISNIQFASGILRIEIEESNPSGMTFDRLNIALENLQIGAYSPVPVGDNSGYVKTYSLDGLPIDFSVPLNLEADIVVQSDTYNPGSTISVTVTAENTVIAEAVFVDPIAVNEEFTELVSFAEIKQAQLSSGVLAINLDYANNPANLNISSFDLWLGTQQLSHLDGSLTEFSLEGVELVTTEAGTLDLRGVFTASSNKYIPGSLVTADVSVENMGISSAVLVNPVTIDSKANGQTISQPLTVEKVKEITFNSGYIDIELDYAGNLVIDEAQFSIAVGGQALPFTRNGQIITVDLSNQTLIFPDDSNVLDLVVDFVVSSDSYIAGAPVNVSVLPGGLGIGTAILKEAIVVNEVIEDVFQLADIHAIDFAEGVLNIDIAYAGGISIQAFEISIGGQVLSPLDETLTKFSLAGVSLEIPEGTPGLAITASLTAEASEYVGGQTVDVNVSLTDLNVGRAVLTNPISRFDMIGKNIEKVSFEGIDVQGFTINNGTLDVDFTYSTGLELDYNFALIVGGVTLNNLGTTVISQDESLKIERTSYDLAGQTFEFMGVDQQIPIEIQYDFQVNTYVNNPTVSVSANLNQFELGMVHFAEGSQVIKQETMSFDVPDQAEKVTFASGELAITVEGIEVDADIEISIAGNPLEKMPDSNTFILAGYTIDFSTLQGQQLPVVVDAVIPLDNLTIGTARELVITAEFSNLALADASLAQPETFDLQLSERVDLGDVEELKSLRFGSGSLTVLIDDAGLGLEMPEEPSISINGQPLLITEEIDGTKHIFTVDLTGQEFDFTTLTELTFDVNLSGSASRYIQGKEILVEATLNNVLDQMEIVFDFEEEIPIDLSALDEIGGASDLINSLQLDRNAFDVNLYFSNNSALGLSLQGLHITGYKESEVVIDEILTLDIPAQSDHFNLLEDSTFLDTLFAVLEEMPDTVVVQFGKFVTNNPSGEPYESIELTFEGGDYSVNLGFVLDGSVELKPMENEDMAVDLPVEDFDLDSYIKEAILYVEVENHLPVDAEITLKLSSNPENVYTEDAEITRKLILPETVVDASGKVIQSATHLNLIQLDGTDFELLQNEMYAGLIVKVNQGGQAKTMTMSINDYLALKIWAKVTVKINQE